MAQRTLATFSAPTINGLDAAMIFANTAMENIYQAEIEKGGRGCTQKFSNDTTGAQIRVIRPLPLPIEARELGKAINGGNFSAYRYEPASQSYGLNIITVIDDKVDIPDVSMDMIPVDVAKMYIKNISDKVVLNINALKIAARVFTCLSADEVDSTTANVIKYNASTDKLLDKVVKTNAQLNRGDRANGVSTFPMNDRIGLVSSIYYAEFLTSSGVLSLGGANYGYDILRKGGLDASTETPALLDDGYIGTIIGIPFHYVSDVVMGVACKYCGFPEDTLDNVICHISSAHGNLFGLATGNSIKTIDCPEGQGVRLLPKYRMGAACILPKSVSWLVDGETWINPYGVKELFPEVEFGYVAPGSREKYNATLTAGSTATAFTVNVDTNTVHYGKFVVGECFTIQEFLAEYNSSDATKGDVGAFGVQTTFAGVGAGETVSVLVSSTDGTLALVRAKAHA